MKFFVTGSAGFIGYHISKRLLDEGWRVIGIDCMSDYYEVSLKSRREEMLLQSKDFRSIHEKVETPEVLLRLFEEEKPNVVIHLAAQAGVRYSIENPRAYLESNIVGTFELLQAARTFPPDHMLLASTSSAYGANENMPYKENDKADNQMSFYAATKRSTESMAHSYSHLFNLPITIFRFFTVYGPWGRPDMAIFRFTKSILNGQKIDIYNHGNMVRDFTYIDDIVEGIVRCCGKPATANVEFDPLNPDPATAAAPHRVFNIGNSQPTELLRFIEVMEQALGRESVKDFRPMQPGDVVATAADTKALKEWVGFTPSTSIELGVSHFAKWFKLYYRL